MENVTTNQVVLPNGETIHYREKGQGRLLILLHGNMTSSFHLEQFISSMPDDIHVIAPDMRGFGHSSYHMPIDSLGDFSDDLAQFTASLQLTNYTLAGWSTGGGVAMLHAIRHPQQVNGLVLISSVGIAGYPIVKTRPDGQPSQEFIQSKQDIAYDPMFIPLLAAFKSGNREFIKMVWDTAVYNHNKPDSRLYQAYLDDILKQRNLIDVYYALATFNLSSKHNGISEGSSLIEQLTTPTLILHGEDDLVLPLDTAITTQHAINAQTSDVTLIRYPQCGHSLFVDTPDELHHELIAFVADRQAVTDN